MPVLSLNNARILHARGWGKVSPNVDVRVELSDDATFSLYRSGFFGETKALSVSLNMLSLSVWTDNVRSGGGFIGGGFGAAGAVVGMLGASVLNALTARSREYSMLGVFAFPGDGSQIELVLAFPDIRESDLRERLGQAIPKWTERYVDQFLNVLHTHHITDEDARATYIQLEQAAERDLLSAAQIERMRSALAHVVPPPKRETVYELRKPEHDRVAELKILADLRASGALTQEEFEAEKARLLCKQ